MHPFLKCKNKIKKKSLWHLVLWSKNKNYPLQPQLNQHQRLFMSLVLVRYPAFVGAFYLGSCPKSCCKFDHQQFLYELCLPVKMRAGTSTMPGRKALWLWLSGSCISFQIECVSVSPMRQKESYWRHHVGQRLPASKSPWMRMSVARHEPLSSWPALGQENCSWSHKKCFGTFMARLHTVRPLLPL